MNIDELRSAQSKERQKSDLQQLRETFYGDVAAYVEELEAERERAADAAEDPFGSPEVQQLTNDIETAKDTAEAIYERRLGKIVKKASLVSAEMANPNDVTGLTAEEQALFADLVDRIEDNKAHMLDVIAGDASPGPREDATGSADAASADANTDATADANTNASAASANTASAGSDVPRPEDGLDASAGDATDATGSMDATSADAADADAADATQATGATDDDDPLRSEAEAVAGTDDDRPIGDEPLDADGAGNVSAADLMGGDDDAVDTATDRNATDAGEATDATDATEVTDAGEATDAGDSTAGTMGSTGGAAGSTGAEGDRSTLRVTEDVGEIFGVDEREYTLTSEDVVTLPEENADALVSQGAAERLD